MSRYRKASLTLMSLVLIAAVYLFVFFAVNQINQLKILKVKGDLQLYMNIDDRGSEILTLSQSSAKGVKYLQMFALMESSSVPREMDVTRDIESTLSNIKDRLGDEHNLVIRGSDNGDIYENGIEPPKHIAGTATIGAGLAWPTEYQTLTDGYGWRFKHPVHGDTRFHNGIDIVAPEGSSIFSASEGKVVRVDKTGTTDLGKYVMIQTGNYQFRYGHMSVVSVNSGDKVKAGEEIGKAGNTGASTGAHLHFEIREIREGDDPLYPPSSRAIPPCAMLGNYPNCYRECYDRDDKTLCGGSPDYSYEGIEVRSNVMTIPLLGGRRGSAELSIW
ncbi:MAG: M23 family metallopeptidase [Candidatus Aenigmarchaeota archaeon]|nr:M23 family metallopeptidase [Candidatus Aenigmarchaeota archaeon]